MPIPRFLHNRMSLRLEVLVKGKLWLQIIAALILGICTGLLIGPDLALIDQSASGLIGDWLALPGRLFLAAIGMVIIPLAGSSIILGITGSGGGEVMKTIGQRLTLFVVSTTIIATIIGISFARLIRPGKDVISTPGPIPLAKPDPSAITDLSASKLDAITRELPNLITGLIPQNLTVSLLEQDMLAIVIFSLFVGIAVVNAGKKEMTTPIVLLSEAILEVCMTVIRTAMRFAPIAVFGLMAETTAANGMQTLADLVVYCGVVLSGLFVLLCFYVLIVWILGAISPVVFIKRIIPVQLLAFSTSSSAAVMPLTMKTAVEKLGVAPSIAGAVVPLASTVNMAGTALYQAAAIMFLADIGGMTLSIGDMALIMVTLTGASIGAPAAPGASIAILYATAANFSIPLIGLPLVIGVDRILDMARTSVNVTGDLVLCRVLSPKGAFTATNTVPNPNINLEKPRMLDTKNKPTVSGLDKSNVTNLDD